MENKTYVLEVWRPYKNSITAFNNETDAMREFVRAKKRGDNASLRTCNCTSKVDENESVVIMVKTRILVTDKNQAIITKVDMEIIPEFAEENYMSCPLVIDDLRTKFQPLILMRISMQLLLEDVVRCKDFFNTDIPFAKIFSTVSSEHPMRNHVKKMIINRLQEMGIGVEHLNDRILARIDGVDIMNFTTRAVQKLKSNKRPENDEEIEEYETWGN